MAKESLISLCADIRATMEAFDANLEKAVSGKHGWKAAARRARKESCALGKLCKAFRKASIRAADEDTTREHVR